MKIKDRSQEQRSVSLHMEFSGQVFINACCDLRVNSSLAGDESSR